MRFEEHTGFVTAMTKHPRLPYVATCDSNRQIMIWDIQSTKLMNKITYQKGRGAFRLDFNEPGHYLAALVYGDNFTIHVFDTNRSTEFCSTELLNCNVRDLKFKSDNEIVTIGEDHFYCWKILDGRLCGSPGRFFQANTNLFTVKKNREDLICGTSHGELQIWRDSVCVEALYLHDGILCAISANNLYIITGGTDKMIQISNVNYTILTSLDLKTLIPDSINPIPHSIETGYDSHGFFVSLRSGHLVSCQSR